MKLLLLLALPALAAVLRAPGEIDWKASGSLPPGAEYHLIREDASTHGVQILVRFPKGYSLPSHAHSTDETLLVLRGKLEIGSGSGTTALGPGGYAVFPAGEPHALAAKGWGGCELLVTMAGAFDLKPAAPAKSAGQ